MKLGAAYGATRTPDPPRCLPRRESSSLPPRGAGTSTSAASRPASGKSPPRRKGITGVQIGKLPETISQQLENLGMLSKLPRSALNRRSSIRDRECPTTGPTWAARHNLAEPPRNHRAAPGGPHAVLYNVAVIRRRYSREALSGHENQGVRNTTYRSVTLYTVSQTGRK
jgi:hypothetical protein